MEVEAQRGEVTYLYHTAHKQQSWDLNLGLYISGTWILLTGDFSGLPRHYHFSYKYSDGFFMNHITVPTFVSVCGPKSTL